MRVRREDAPAPGAGLLTLPYETLSVPADPEQTIVVYTPEPGSETAERLALLGSWTSAVAEAPERA